jgi:hypothetical protein
MGIYHGGDYPRRLTHIADRRLGVPQAPLDYLAPFDQSSGV